MDEVNHGLIPRADPEAVELTPALPEMRRARESRYLLPAGALATLLLCLGALLATRFTLCLNVKVDGETVGVLTDEGALEAIVDTAEETVADILGYSYPVESRVSYSYGIISASAAEELDAHTVERGIYDHIEEIDMHYVITVDGVEVGYAAELTALRTAMDNRLAELSAEGTVSAHYLTEVEFDYDYVDVGEELTPESIEELVAGLSVEVVEQVTYTEPIPHTVDIVQDDERLIEDTQTLREGADGEAEVVAEVTYIDGEEMQHTVLQTVVLAEAVSEIIVEGTQERPLTASYGEYIWPVAGTVSSYFGPRSVSIGSSNHLGVDIACPANEYVYAADGGEVVFAGWSGGYGNLVQIEHDNGDVTYYAHNNSIDVSVGERVYQGQPIARAGMTGTASGNHVHFELRVDGTPVDPLTYLP